jgi:light-regulated signal transduction histidine kinase (bacteriophytochrome)
MIKEREHQRRVGTQYAGTEKYQGQNTRHVLSVYQRTRKSLSNDAQLTHVSGQVTKIDSNAMLDRTVANLPAAIDASGGRITHTGLPEIMADPSLEQVFQNLISNAIKYGRDGVPTEIDVSARSDGDAWVFAVRDNGIGIDPLQMGNVFRIFRRLHGREIPGNGIGLALSKRIVEAHGGSIWVESAPNLHAASGKGGAAPEPAQDPARTGFTL